VAEEPLDLAAQETGEPDLLDFGLLGCAKPPRTAVGQADDAGVHSGVTTAGFGETQWKSAWADMASVKHNGSRHGGLQTTDQRRADSLAHAMSVHPATIAEQRHAAAAAAEASARCRKMFVCKKGAAPAVEMPHGIHSGSALADPR
jgi:hypothetical protein